MLRGLKRSGSLPARVSLPSSLPQAFPPNVLTALFYCGSVTIFFAVIKLISYRLHLMFDKGEAIQHRSPRKRSKRKPEGEASSQHTARHKNPRYPCSGECQLPKELLVTMLLSAPPKGKDLLLVTMFLPAVGLSLTLQNTCLALTKARVQCWAPPKSGIVVCAHGRWRWVDWEFKVIYRCIVSSRPMCATRNLGSK